MRNCPNPLQLKSLTSTDLMEYALGIALYPNNNRLMMDSGVVVRSDLRVVTIGPIRRAFRQPDSPR
jgi:hypothetical protein